MKGLVSSLTTGFTDVATQALNAVGGIVPVMLPVVGGIAVVKLGVKIFRSLGS